MAGAPPILQISEVNWDRGSTERDDDETLTGLYCASAAFHEGRARCDKFHAFPNLFDFLQ